MFGRRCLDNDTFAGPRTYPTAEHASIHTSGT